MASIWDSFSFFSLDLLVNFIPTLVIIALTLLLLKLLGRRRAVEVEGERFRDQLLSLMTIIAALIGVALVLPIEPSVRGQLLTLLGLLLTAIITLSSTTIAANATAGFMMRSLRTFSAGDFIQVGDYFGRVTEQDLFHTEIQTEDRDLLTIPNVYLAANPVKVVHASGTVISAEVSLGYDVDNRHAEKALLAAAAAAELADPFVYILSLGDFSIVYRIAGRLDNVKQILSVRSNLRRQMIDHLHLNNIEVVSPGFMNQRQVTESVLPERRHLPANAEANSRDGSAADQVFDKAEKAQQIKDLKEHYAELKGELAEISAADSDDVDEQMARKKRRLKAVKRALAMLER